MNAPPPPVALQFPDDFQVSWVGPNPFTPGLCFGSEDGKLHFTNSAGKVLGADPYTASPSREPINGVAATSGRLAVSTRADVTLHRMFVGKGIHRTTFHRGAHGILATRGGLFAAPSGKMGLVVIDPAQGAEGATLLGPARQDSEMYLYRVAPSPFRSKPESLVCACRVSGVAEIQLSLGADAITLHRATYKGADVIDVCPLRTRGAHSAQSIAAGTRARAFAVRRTSRPAPRPTPRPAFVAAAKDGSISLFRESLQKQQQRTLRFDKLKGQVYRVLESRGHLVLLTSEALYVHLDFVDSLLAEGGGQPSARATYELPVRAVDANLGSPTDVLVITESNEVLKVSLVAIEAAAQTGTTRRERNNLGTPVDFSVNWESAGIEQRRGLVPVEV